MEPGLVTKEEFDKFIKEYPRKLTTRSIRVVDPPCKAYYDGETLVGFIRLDDTYEYIIEISL